MDPLAQLVAASGYSNDAVLGDHARFGFNAALAKPFRLEELREVLGVILNAVGPAE
jgi:CheY-like chemotaxis protein